MGQFTGSLHGQEQEVSGGGHVMGVVLIVLIIGAFSIYLRRWDVRRHPFRPCPRCGGKRQNPGSSAQRFGLCRKCGGRGAVLRYGAPKS
jgi:hypothetical protein